MGNTQARKSKSVVNVAKSPRPNGKENNQQLQTIDANDLDRGYSEFLQDTLLGRYEVTVPAHEVQSEQRDSAPQTLQRK